MNVAGSPDSPPWTRIVRVAGLDVTVTRLRSAAEQFRCEPHGALVNATLKADGWHSYASCRICSPEALRDVLDGIAAGNNGHQQEKTPPVDDGGAADVESDGARSDNAARNGTRQAP